MLRQVQEELEIRVSRDLREASDPGRSARSLDAEPEKLKGPNQNAQVSGIIAG